MILDSTDLDRVPQVGTRTEWIRIARPLTRDNRRISVTLARMMAYWHSRGETVKVCLAVAALKGDPTVRAFLEDAADNGSPDAFVLLAILEDLEGMATDASELAAEVAQLEPAEELRDTSTTEVERLEITPHRPVDTGALPPVSLPRAPQHERTPNRVCSAKRTRGPLEEVHHR